MDQGFANATDMVGPAIEVWRPSKTETALDAPPGFFTAHLASLKSGLRYPLNPLLVEFLNEVDLLPYKLVPNSHRYIAGYLVKCQESNVTPSLDHFLFTFKLTRGHKDSASYACLSQRSSKLFTSDKKGSTNDWKPFFVFVSTGPESPFTGSRHPLYRRITPPLAKAKILDDTKKLFRGGGGVEIRTVVTEESLAKLGFEFRLTILYSLVEQEGEAEDDMEQQLMLHRLKAEKKRKRDAAPKAMSSACPQATRVASCWTRLLSTWKTKERRLPQWRRGQWWLAPPSRTKVLGRSLLGATGATRDASSQRPPLSLALTFEVQTEGGLMKFSIPHHPSSGIEEFPLETKIVLPSTDQACISASSTRDLANMVLLKFVQAPLGVLELARRANVHQSTLDEVKEATEAEKELRGEVDRLAKELLEEGLCNSNLLCRIRQLERENYDLNGEKTSLSSQVESVSTWVAELEVEKGDLVCCLEGVVETFKASPEFRVTVMEQMEKLVLEWVKTKPEEDWMVEQAKVSYQCGLFQAQQFFRCKLFLLPKGTPLLDFGLPPPSDNIDEFDPTPYMEEEDSDDLEGGSERTGPCDQGNQGDQGEGASLMATKASEGTGA
ncbi:unnamed protein product [Cuscuta campestris]|uniref:Uncharacterized protein n=1 Tax=Cuscuta campestris TaxID=132261 RepID=A0A484MMY5_9ASTE|nr:unnamed protein product [Cuscuta campestris]